MAGVTAQIEIDGDDWTVIAQNCTAAFVQLIQNGPVLVAVAAAKPDAGSGVGMMLYRDEHGITFVPLTGLESGVDIVYAKCKNDETEKVTVLTTAPAA